MMHKRLPVWNKIHYDIHPVVLVTGIVFPFIIWFYGSAIVINTGWGCGFGDSEDIVTWSDNRPSFTVLGFMAVVAYCRGI
jgi:hypothetical protein